MCGNAQIKEANDVSMHQDLMNLQEIADYCGISKDLVRREIAAKRLKARKTGKGWTTLRHIVEDYREEFYKRGIE